MYISVPGLHDNFFTCVNETVCDCIKIYNVLYECGECVDVCVCIYVRVYVCVFVCSFSQFLAAFAGLYNHIGKLLNFRGLANEVKDGKRFQVLGHAARRG